ncbi:MAG: Single-stranded DNA-binding protein [Anaerolineae bacterium]|nr:Single-stranded DNA-binding protein [Anaerolineae bacterium]
MDYQKLILMGNTTAVPKVQTPEGKTAFADFRLAVSRGPEGETDFFPVRVFGKLAEVVATVKKGTRLLVEGRIELNQYTPEGGQPRLTVRVLVNTVQFI